MAITITPTLYFHRHQLGTVPFLNLLVSVNFDGTWYLHNDPSMLFTLNGENIAEINGGGEQLVQVKMTNSINQYDEGLYEFKLRAFNFAGTEEETLTILMFVTQTEDDAILPKTLNFEAVRNVYNAPEQKFYIATGDSGVTINLPDFLQLVSHDLVGGGHIVTVKPVMQSLTLDKEYNDQIEVILPSEIDPQYVSVNYIIHAGYDENYTQPVHFTRDNDELVFWKTTPENSFLRLLVSVKSFTNTSEIHKDIQLALDIPFVNTRAKINIGREVEPYLFDNIPAKFKSKSTGVYPPAELRMVAMEIKYDDYSILNEDVLPLQYYLRGRNPLADKSTNRPFWLETRPAIARLSGPAAYLSLNIFKPAHAEIHKIEMKKNGEFVKYIEPETQTFGLMRPGVAGVQVKITNALPGDVFSFKYPDAGVEKKVIIGQSPQDSIAVAFLNEFNTYDWFEFTGVATGTVNYNHDTSEFFTDYIKKSKKIDVSKTQKITLNTGWLFSEESFIIDELIACRKAWIMNNLGQLLSISDYDFENLSNVEVIPVQSKITNIDTDNNLVQYDVEFLINPENENRTYSR